jgi:hypothetical protein
MRSKRYLLLSRSINRAIQIAMVGLVTPFPPVKEFRNIRETIFVKTTKQNQYRTEFFIKILLGIWEEIGRRPVPYAFREADGTIRSLDAGCLGFLVNNPSLEWKLRFEGNDPAGFIVAVEPPTRVHGQNNRVGGKASKLETALLPSRAVPPAVGTYWMGETDGPKYLYILELNGDIAAYLGRPADQVDRMSIIKVGFSRSPLSRRDQIQSAYPRGQFKWVVRYPENIDDLPPYPNAMVAITGEDAMKKRLVDEGAEVLGGEFFLADEGQIIRTWYAGKYAADTANDVPET